MPMRLVRLLVKIYGKDPEELELEIREQGKRIEGRRKEREAVVSEHRLKYLLELHKHGLQDKDGN